MAAAVVAPNNAPSPHSSAASSPQSHTSHLPQHTNAPLYTQEEVVRFVQAALAAAYRDQSVHANARPSSNVQSLQEDRIMKPRVHMYETLGAKRMMITTLELPGLQKDDVHITARPNGELIISGERRPQHLHYLQNIRGENDHNRSREESGEESGRTVFNELKFGKFQRSIRLPAGTDPSTITASMDDGMLTITWPLPPCTRTSINHDVVTTNDAQMNEGLVKLSSDRVPLSRDAAVTSFA
ncbi:hypothetical protein ACEPAF_2665 [Sanghuangporus sanghuang]